MNLNRDEIRRAAQRIADKVVRTDTHRIDSTLTLKLEGAQRSGSFKARGAMNAMLCSTIGADGVVAASGGNHGAAVAWAAQELGHTANIFVPSIISPSKLEKLNGYGAVVHVEGNEYQETLHAVRSFKQGRHCVELHAYDQTEVVLGAGTLAMEIDEQVPDVTTVVVACGGGGLSAGLATWWGTSKRLIVVETEGTQTFARSLVAGEPVDVEVSGVAADSLGARRLGNIAWQALMASGAESQVVSDEQVKEAQFQLNNDFDVIAEPAAAAGYAAVLSGQAELTEDESCVVIICGSNTS